MIEYPDAFPYLKHCLRKTSDLISIIIHCTERLGLGKDMIEVYVYILIESIWCCCLVNKEKILIGCIFRPNDASDEGTKQINKILLR